MNRTAVNLGAGGFVSYYEDGGAAVILDPYLENNQGFSEEPDYAEKGVGSFLLEQLCLVPSRRHHGLVAGRNTQLWAHRRLKVEMYTIRKGHRFLRRLRTDYNYPTEESV
jgi:hypothetical protein